ncbi:MAG: ABC transporter ATP-binding protein [Clostridium sp.]|jgi:putative spermidine/putrescine transport system ATP-binding protein/spermidine/putrescine transport system ATP-binding protein|uniref:ABC transporter ATP-binding protein n=1 Tax=Clostridium sp. TaxID=1506 RepID=UPI0025C0A622|nr:ABC transporter ATP-binding protein [Clostridium sp.]MCH3965761.1 ABC transporter ATP-binding protein [Clostridium sp.]MCI1717170.1 ABC transporter ATP-binding protein [Clostridium sp.]MCI1801510.1 ABC transporter ATP-binding protein [Clostridium sp.]MCI1815359.1 ABC transporter ATP-binding protein [Clostridium sp.]MCI1872262.1 ABC transporter ATP-binding protein [Clostridium sp.]
MTVIGADLLVDKVEKYYKSFKAVDKVSFKVNKGEFLTILGPSGSGKTSLLKLIAGFEKINSGQILLNNDNIEKKKPYERNIGMLFQNYALFPHMTVFDNIAYPLKIRKVNKDDIKKRVNDMLKMIDLEEVAKRYPKQLSGGQQQRVALARAIVFNPPLLLLDEPLGALDKHLRQKMQLEIKHIQQKIGITTISVTHDQEEALTMSDKVCIMNKGQLEQIDTPENIYQKPKSRFAAEFIGEINLIDGKIIETEGKLATVEIFNKKIVKAEMEEPDQYLQGKAVSIALRPENIVVSKGEAKYDNNISVVVKEVIFVGDSLKVKVVNKKEQEMIVKVDVEDSIKNLLTEGQEIILNWETDKCSLIGN